MTKEETKKILTVINAAYPTFYKDSTEEDIAGAIGIWYEMLKDCPYQDVVEAVKSFISTNEFAPTIAGIKKYIYKNKNYNILSENDAWNIVRKALTNSLYNSEEEFKTLPDSVKKIVGSSWQLKSWATEDERTIDSVIASNFRKAYKTEMERKQEYQQLPTDTKEKLENGTKMMIEE